MMALAGKDRRGLQEIIAIASLFTVLGVIVILELVFTHTVSKELIIPLAAVAGVLPIRGMQSAMERSASSEVRNHEAGELRSAAERFEKAIDRMETFADDSRRTAAENQRHSMEIIERLMTAATRIPRGD
jgi:hypothetical protein